MIDMINEVKRKKSCDISTSIYFFEVQRPTLIKMEGTMKVTNLRTEIGKHRTGQNDSSILRL